MSGCQWLYPCPTVFTFILLLTYFLCSYPTIIPNKHFYYFMYTNVLPACMYVCTSRAFLVFSEMRRGHQILSDWDRQLWVHMWVLGIDPALSSRATRALNHGELSGPSIIPGDSSFLPLAQAPSSDVILHSPDQFSQKQRSKRESGQFILRLTGNSMFSPKITAGPNYRHSSCIINQE